MKKKILLFFIPLLFLALNSSAEEDISLAEFHFLFGYQDFIQRNFSEAQKSFHEAAKQASSEEMKNRSKLFEALTLAKLKKNDEAAALAADIKPEELEKRDLKIFGRIKSYLGEKYNVALRKKNAEEEKKVALKIALSPRLLSTSYSAGLSRETSLYMGAEIHLVKPRWSFVASAENSNHSFLVNSQNYDQLHLNFLYLWKGTNLDWNFHTGFLKSDMAAQNGQNLGFKIGGNFFDHVGLFFDYSLANYPESDLGALSINQAKFLFDYWFLKSKESDVKVVFSTQSIRPQSDQIQSGSSFIKDQFFHRFQVELEARIESFKILTYYWTGEEVFASRREGRDIFTYPEIHQGGLGTTFAFYIDQSDVLKLNYYQESITIHSSRGQSTSLMASYDYYFE